MHTAGNYRTRKHIQNDTNSSIEIFSLDTKEKNNKLNFFKIKIPLKDPDKKTKRWAIDLEKILASHILTKWLVSGI